MPAFFFQCIAIPLAMIAIGLLISGRSLLWMNFQEQTLEHWVYCLFALFTLALALLVGVMENWADNGRSMMFTPMEHVYSTGRVLVNLATALVCVAWSLTASLRRVEARPSLPLMVVLAAAGMVGGAFSAYYSRIGFCCETGFAWFVGLPFSWGYWESDQWVLRVGASFLNVLFWLNVAYLAASLLAIVPVARRQVNKLAFSRSLMLLFLFFGGLLMVTQDGGEGLRPVPTPVPILAPFLESYPAPTHPSTPLPTFTPWSALYPYPAPDS